MKKTLSVSMVALLTLFSASLPMRAEAAVGLLISAIGNQDTKPIGYVLAGIGGFTSLIGLTAGPEVPNCWGTVTCSCEATTCTMAIAPGESGGMDPGPSANPHVINIGLILLGTSVSPQIEFQQLQASQDADFNLKENERLAFNAQLTKINLIANSLQAQVKEAVLNGANAEQAIRETQEVWQTQAQPVLQADAYSAATKVSAAYVKSWQVK